MLILLYATTTLLMLMHSMFVGLMSEPADALTMKYRWLRKWRVGLQRATKAACESKAFSGPFKLHKFATVNIAMCKPGKLSKSAVIIRQDTADLIEKKAACMKQQRMMMYVAVCMYGNHPRYPVDAHFAFV